MFPCHATNTRFEPRHSVSQWPSSGGPGAGEPLGPGGRLWGRASSGRGQWEHPDGLRGSPGPLGVSEYLLSPPGRTLLISACCSEYTKNSHSSRRQEPNLESLPEECPEA